MSSNYDVWYENEGTKWKGYDHNDRK